MYDTYLCPGRAIAVVAGACFKESILIQFSLILGTAAAVTVRERWWCSFRAGQQLKTGQRPEPFFISF